MSLQCTNDDGAIEELSDESYEAKKEQIPVFCVSAKVSLHLRNIRAYEDIPTKKINNEDDTDIPALSEHLMQLAKSMREELSENSLKTLSTAVNSVYLYVRKTSTKQVVDSSVANEAAKESEVLLQSLRASLEKWPSTCFSSIENYVQIQLKNKKVVFAKQAVREAVEVLGALGEYPTRQNPGGLYVQEYKAIVIGRGIHVGRRVKVNFNKKIVRCLDRALYSSMNRIFLSSNSRAEQELQLLIKTCVEKLESTHNEMRQLADNAGVSPIAFAMVEDQFKKRKAFLHSVQREVGKVLKDVPSSAGKDLKNYVQKEMTIAYEKAQNAKKGLGMMGRMSSEVLAGVEKQNGALMDRCFDEFEKALHKVTSEAADKLSAQLKEFADRVSQNYQDAFRQRDEHHWTSDNPNIRRMLLKSGLISHKQLTEDDRMFYDEDVGIKLEGGVADVNMGGTDGERGDRMEDVDTDILMDPIEELDAAIIA